ncbi:class I SAM-dependent methyltransferase [Auraticoccus monumenti]|uniref:Methyltransferase domain-containing protein n=1 Tax=Auraticoccus monumenti TaxID=675864 RepID=A0A1G6ZZ34_9ACTN|nr:class I SAM-dependent methyltransferase [Auraticoccus monumenti]SDE06896.1 Methyltransferase domain-containing protein [Auraticoccus monumenti]
MPDLIFSDPVLARLYDPLDPVRDDLDAYLDLVDELGAQSVLDVGCGTGSLAVLLAGRGADVVGLDPAAASLEVARGKPGADRVRWVEGDAAALPPLQVDLAVMTGNVAQVFVTDEDWAATLTAVHRALRPGGWLVFETRVPEREAWREWDPVRSRVEVDVPGFGRVASWTEVTAVDGPLVTFDSHVELLDRDQPLPVSTSTLRFRSQAELGTSLGEADFEVSEVREAPDRPGRELVVLARRSGGVGALADPT